MGGNGKQNAEKNSSLNKSSTWVYDERWGWIDVKEFLKRTTKLGQEIKEKNRHKTETCSL